MDKKQWLKIFRENTIIKEISDKEIEKIAQILLKLGSPPGWHGDVKGAAKKIGVTVDPKEIEEPLRVIMRKLWKDSKKRKHIQQYGDEQVTLKDKLESHGYRMSKNEKIHVYGVSTKDDNPGTYYIEYKSPKYKGIDTVQLSEYELKKIFGWKV